MASNASRRSSSTRAQRGALLLMLAFAAVSCGRSALLTRNERAPSGSAGDGGSGGALDGAGGSLPAPGVATGASGVAGGGGCLVFDGCSPGSTGSTATSASATTSAPPPPGCVAEVAAGLFHTCARRTDGTLWCWGSNVFGQLGTGNLADHSTPVQLDGLGTSVARIWAGSASTCATLEDGTLWCWANNTSGQIGNGSTCEPSPCGEPHPIPVAALGASVAAVAIGADHTCAVDLAGALWCWGDDAYGQLGDGASCWPSPCGTAQPAQVTGLLDVAEVSAGSIHTCARNSDGSVWCWGDAVGSSNSKVASPVLVDGLGPATQISAGSDYNCVRLTEDASVWCWGDNLLGQLGDGTKTDSLEPRPVVGLGPSVAHIVTGGNHTCARMDNGTLWCWGHNSVGQLGQGTANHSALVPVPVSALGASVVDVVAGGVHTCAITADRNLWCWGRNDASQVGDGTTEPRLLPVRVDVPCP